MGNNLSYKQILESLNNIDKKCIDEDTTFYDLRETFKSLVEDLSYEDREDIKDVIDATKNMPNDKAADTIAAVLVAKDSNGEKNESLEEDDDTVDKIIDINTLNPEDLKLLAVYIVNDARKESVIHEEDLVEALELDSGENVNVSQSMVSSILKALQNCNSIYIEPIPKNRSFMDKYEIEAKEYIELFKQIKPSDFRKALSSTFDKYKGDTLLVFHSEGVKLRDDILNLDIYVKINIDKSTGKSVIALSFHELNQFENLKEASYGGAYDIEDDMFFIKDELVEFGYDLVDKFSNWAGCKADLANVYMTSPVDLVIEVLEDDDITHQAKVRIDMRKIKLPKDIYKYEDAILKQWEDSYNEYHEYDECFIKEDIDEIYSYEQMENELKFASDNWTKDPFEGNVYYEEEFDYAIEILSKYYENVKRQRRGNHFWFKATRPSLFEDTEKNSKGKWVNRGKEGTHGEFKTKKEADAQRKSMFANGYSESLDSSDKEKGYCDIDFGSLEEAIDRSFIELETFKKSWKELNLTDEDLLELQNLILNKPELGIPLGNNVFKIRFSPSSLNKGKDTSDRVIYIDIIKDSLIYLVIAFSKSDESTLTPSELKAIKNIADEVK